MASLRPPLRPVGAAAPPSPAPPASAPGSALPVLTGSGTRRNSGPAASPSCRLRVGPRVLPEPIRRTTEVVKVANSDRPGTFVTSRNGPNGPSTTRTHCRACRTARTGSDASDPPDGSYRSSCPGTRHTRPGPPRRPQSCTGSMLVCWRGRHTPTPRLRRQPVAGAIGVGDSHRARVTAPSDLVIARAMLFQVQGVAELHGIQPGDCTRPANRPEPLEVKLGFLPVTAWY